MSYSGIKKLRSGANNTKYAKGTRTDVTKSAYSVEDHT